MKCKLVIHTQMCMNRFAPRYAKAQKFLDSEVLRGCGPFVPMRTGHLMKSGNTGTVIGSGKVIYNALYAKKCFYARNTRFSKDKHPKACAQWIVPAKAEHLQEWRNGVDQILTGG